MTDPAQDRRPDDDDAQQGDGVGASDDEPRTEPGSDLPGAGAEDLHQVAQEVDAAMADAARGTGFDGAAGGGDGVDDGAGDPLTAALGLAEARLGDLQRERAEFVNYRRRVERDREKAGVEGRTSVLLALLPVLDDIDGARTHGDLVGPFAGVADKLDGILQRLGLEAFGEAGDHFDPALHEALLQDAATEVDQPTCTQVLQRGYRSGDRVIRPARVAVATPQ